ncbi:MAG: rhodanese-like domain-containing protein [Polyangiaceae bacterium]|jgi:rhodanese-related sulfurtransferase
MIRSIGPAQARELITCGTLEVVDVRDSKEWTAGHVPGARLVPLESLRSAPKALLPRDGVIFVCAAGMRSQTAARVAEANGLSNVYNLTGGTRGWQNAGFPLEVGEPAPSQRAS